MRTVYWVLLLVVAVAATALVTKRVDAARAAPAPAVASGAPVGTIRDVMKGIVDPNATALWDAVGTESNEKGVVEKSPKTDEDWEAVEHRARTLAEAANLLTTPGRPRAAPDEGNHKSRPDAPEHTPTQIQEKISQNPDLWTKHAKELQAAAVKAMAAAKSHDKDGLLNVGEVIDNACEGCHLVYWYPDDPGAKAAAQ
jgi:cytochrome c556